MSEKIMIVEDNEELLFNEQLLLEMNGYSVITAINGEDALNKLHSIDQPPALILSDIMMPKLNGYDLFAKVSQHQEWQKIPFVFLSAKSSPEDVRFGKMLGADDYMIKPFSEEALISLIEKRLRAQKKVKNLEDQIQRSEVSHRIEISNIDFEKVQTKLMVVIWDDKLGPDIKKMLPNKEVAGIPIYELANQLFESSVGIYGQNGFYGPEGLLLHIRNIKMDGYLFFDAFEDSKVRGGEQLFMIGVISPSIKYLNSLRLKNTMSEIALKIKNHEEYKLEPYLEQVLSILRN